MFPVKKGYQGQKSYHYLRRGIDYPDFVLAKEVDRVEIFLVPLNREQERELLELVKKHPVVGLHEHVSVTPEDPSKLPDYERSGREHTAFEGLSRSCFDAVFDNLMDGTCIISGPGGWKWTDVLHDLGMRSCDIDHQGFLFQARKVEDIFRAKSEGRIAWFLSCECATPLENELDRIEILYGFGLRMMGIVYSESNMCGSGLKEEGDGGLTSFGHKVVDRLNRVGIAIDVSHCGDRTAKEVIKASRKPVFFTHVGCRALWDMKRLKDDDLFKLCAEHGGVIGVEAAPHTTVTRNNPVHSIDSVMEHFEYLVDLVGIDHVAFGIDALYGDHVALHEVFSSNMSTEETHQKSRSEAEHPPKVEYVRGLENPTEASWNVIRWMVSKGYSEEQIAKVIGGNAIRVLKDAFIPV